MGIPFVCMPTTPSLHYKNLVLPVFMPPWLPYSSLVGLFSSVDTLPPYLGGFPAALPVPGSLLKEPCLASAWPSMLWLCYWVFSYSLVRGVPIAPCIRCSRQSCSSLTVPAPSCAEASFWEIAGTPRRGGLCQRLDIRSILPEASKHSVPTHSY